MHYKDITSADNKTYKELLKLKKGDAKEGIFLVEGVDLVDEAIRANSLISLIVPVDSTYIVEGDILTYRLKESLYRELSSYKSLPVCIGICKKEYSTSLGERIIYLDNVQDPGNCGTIIRTALSFQYSSVVLSNDTVSLYNSKTIQASKGALFHIPVARMDLNELKNRGYNIYLTTLDGEDERNLKELKIPFVLVFGNEGKGIKKEYQNLGKKIKIEMDGIDSLNVAVASGIFMYRFKQN